VGLALGAAAALAAYDGVTLGMREYARTHDGRVTPGVVMAQVDPTKAPRRRVRGRHRLWHDLEKLTVQGSRIHDILGRLILTGSPHAWAVEYRYDCERPQGCYGRDIVPEALWHQLYPGQTIQVRRPNSEIEFSRLEENPQGTKAMLDLATAVALLVAGAAVSGRLKRRGPRYLRAPAVVTAIESLRSGDEPLWRIKFAYFDAKGAAHEGADEVVVATWKPGDEGLAVFPPDRPELATFRPLEPA
jgi:hypothetical protein